MEKFGNSNFPIGVLTDSYKVSHWLLYPDCNFMSAYGEFRAPFESNPSDHRIVFYGIRYIVENYLEKQWTIEDVERSDVFFKTHNAGYTPFPFPKDLFLKFVKENNGYFPVKLESLPEGSVVHYHTPVFQISASNEYSKLCTFLETILTMVWYPTTVATLSRMTKDHIEEAFKVSVDDDSHWLLESRLHDFGFRGTSCVEQSMIGGAAHLLNFTGSDTLSACYYVQFQLNGGRPIGTSIPATEHSVMTAWPTERQALHRMLEKFGSGSFATVLDSYDYDRALTKVIPSLAEKHRKSGGVWVFRPDSGDPIECVLSALKAGEETFGSVTNKKGYKMIRNAACIQGDGVSMPMVKKILDAVLKEGYSAQNVAFGMGGGLLQKVNRDTMSFATKLSFVRFEDGTCRDIMKMPKTDTGKASLPGILRVRRDRETLLETVEPKSFDQRSDYDRDDLLRPVYDCGPIPGVWENFEVVRNRVKEQWVRMPKCHNPISNDLQQKKVKWVEAQKKALDMETFDENGHLSVGNEKNK